MSDYVSWLAGLDERELAELLDNRPEVLRGRPARDLAAVASRLSQQPAVAAALLRQPRPALQVLTALLLFGGRVSVASCAGLLEPAPGGDHVEQVRHWLGALAAYGLAWVDDDDVAHVAPSVGTVYDAPEDAGAPAALLIDQVSKDRLAPVLRAWGLPAQTTKAATAAVLADAFADPVRVAAQVQLLSPAQREALATEGEERPFTDQGWFTRRLDALRAGKAAGVVLGGYAEYEGHTPAEVRVALRDKALPFDPTEPAVPASAASAEMVERESRAALVQFSEACLTVLDHVRDKPLAWLRSGGVGAREVSRVAKACHVEVPTVRLVLECAYAAGLLEWEHAGLVCGQVASAWRDLEPGARVTLLLERWPVMAWSPTRAHDAAGKALAVADDGRDCVRCFDGRMTTLAEWLRVPDGHGVDDAALAGLVAWVRPLSHPAHREVLEEPDPWGRGYRARGRRPGGGSTQRAVPDPFRLPEDTPTLGAVADEARMLGLVAHGAATPLLRALLGGDRPQVVALAQAMLPAASGQARFGSDLTAVVTGPPTGELSALLDSCADRESRGGAVTWRFTTASVRRALDAAVTADELRGRLDAVAASGLPQPLTYLLADVGRRHGSLRVAPAQAVIRSEDEALLAEAVADRKLRKLGLRLVAPTVALSSVGDGETIEALRAAGYLPMPWVEEAGTDSRPSGKAKAETGSGRSGTGGSGAGRSGTGRGGAGRSGVVESAGSGVDEAASGVIDLAARRVARGESCGLDGPAVAPGSDPDLDDWVAEVTAILDGGASGGTGPAQLPEPETPQEAAARLAGTARAAPSPLSAGDAELVAELRRVNGFLSDDEIEILAAAIVAKEPVLIAYRSASGSVTNRVISDLEYSTNLLDAWCHLRNDSRTFLTSEVLSVGYP